MRTKRPGTPILSLAFLLAASALTASPMAPSVIAPPNASARPAATYYLVVYAAQEPGNNPETSHCFATFARIARADGTPPAPRVELRHINWFSIRGHQTGATHGLVEADGQPTYPEPGENRTTRDALILAQRHGLRVSRWGPYEIHRGLFEKAGHQIALLEGRLPGPPVRYKALDLGYREGARVRALNCIHAISDVDREPAPLRTWTSYGDDAARRVVLHLSRWMKNPGKACPAAWAPIWNATWQGATPPAGLEIVRGELPREWERRPSSAIADAGRPE